MRTVEARASELPICSPGEVQERSWTHRCLEAAVGHFRPMSAIGRPIARSLKRTINAVARRLLCARLRPVLASAPVLESGHDVGETLWAALGGNRTFGRNGSWTRTMEKTHEGDRLIERDVFANASVRQSHIFLRGPAVWEVATKHGDGEIGRCAAASDGFDDARRYEGERARWRTWRRASYRQKARARWRERREEETVEAYVPGAQSKTNGAMLGSKLGTAHSTS